MRQRLLHAAVLALFFYLTFLINIAEQALQMRMAHQIIMVERDVLGAGEVLLAARPIVQRRDRMAPANVLGQLAGGHADGSPGAIGQIVGRRLVDQALVDGDPDTLGFC